MKLISTWKPILEGSSSGSGLCFEGRAHVCELKVAGSAASRLPALPPPAIWQAALACTEQQAGSGRQLQAPWPVHAAPSIALHPPQINGSGPDGSVLWDRAGSLTWEDCSEYYIYFCLKNLSHHIIRTT